MSTSLQLPAGNKGSGVAPSSQDRQAGGTRTSKAAAAQGSFPPEIERYMQSQGFAEATPIQQEYVLLQTEELCSTCDIWAVVELW